MWGQAVVCPKHRKMSSMEKNSKKQSQEVEAPKTYKAEEQAVSFDSWFTFKLSQKRKVDAHHYDSIKAYFKHKGLSDMEKPQTYDAMLKVFGF
jgi:hypothetical protein